MGMEPRRPADFTLAPGPVAPAVAFAVLWASAATDWVVSSSPMRP